MSTLERSLASYAAFLDERAVASRPSAVTDTEEEATMVDLDTARHSTRSPAPRRRTPLYAAVAAAVALVASLFVAFEIRSGSDAEPALRPAGPLLLEFDGTRCRYDGPDELPAGRVDVVFVNGSDARGSLVAIRLHEGRTFAELRAYAGPYPSSKHAPAWSSELRGRPDGTDIYTGTWRAVAAGERVAWTIDLVPGRHGLGCAIVGPLAVWVPAELTVVE